MKVKALRPYDGRKQLVQNPRCYFNGLASLLGRCTFSAMYDAVSSILYFAYLLPNVRGRTRARIRGHIHIYFLAKNAKKQIAKLVYTSVSQRQFSHERSGGRRMYQAIHNGSSMAFFNPSSIATTAKTRKAAGSDFAASLRASPKAFKAVSATRGLAR